MIKFNVKSVNCHSQTRIFSIDLSLTTGSVVEQPNQNNTSSQGSGVAAYYQEVLSILAKVPIPRLYYYT